jgi:uncharacterized surface protein with fasciclin (FAS1) repeats
MAEPILRRVTDIVADDPALSMFNNLLRRSKVMADLDTDDAFTIFAPTDEAFDKLPDGAIGKLVADEGRLREVMLFHVAAGMYPRAELRESKELGMLSKQPALLECVGQRTYIGGALIESGDLAAENGYVHTIDTVMFPD